MVGRDPCAVSAQQALHGLRELALRTRARRCAPSEALTTNEFDGPSLAAYGFDEIAGPKCLDAARPLLVKTRETPPGANN